MRSMSLFINAIMEYFFNFRVFSFFFLPIVFFHANGTALAQPFERETPVVRAVRTISPAVVNISSEYEIQQRAYPFSGRGPDAFFDFFFRDFFDPGFERKSKRTSLGSGVIIDGRMGFILTNAHVIQSTGAVTVLLQDGREYGARVKGSDPDSDLAVLQIDSDSPLPAVKMGNSEDLMIGETVIAIGNPFGFSHTVTTGVISAINRSIRTDDAVYHNFIQTDASINPGNSGGPLLNINGELIGINTAIYAKAQGIGFAIPIDAAKRIVTDLIQYGEVIPIWTGVVVQQLDLRLARYLDLPDNIKGVLAREVESDSPAEKAGIRAGDVILSIADVPVESEDSFVSSLRKFAAGDNIVFDVMTNGKRKRVTLAAAIYPLEKAMDLSERLLGIRVEGLTWSNRRRYNVGTDEAVIITKVAENSYLSEIGVLPGDIILKIDETVVKNVDTYKEAIVKYRMKSSAVILLQRENRGYYITVRF